MCLLSSSLNYLIPTHNVLAKGFCALMATYYAGRYM